MKKTGYALAVGVIMAAGSFWGYTNGFAQGGHGMGQGMMGQGGGGMGHGMMGRHGAGHQGNMIRHRVIRMGGGVPAPYTNVKNPLPANEANIVAGKAMFTEQCASCHGKSGIGDGEAGRELQPKPANIAFIMDKWIATDPFLFWSISEGGERLETAMPAFKETLSDKQRWQIIHYLRNGLANSN